jgi:hypothetical protein
LHRIPGLDARVAGEPQIKIDNVVQHAASDSTEGWATAASAHLGQRHWVEAHIASSGFGPQPPALHRRKVALRQTCESDFDALRNHVWNGWRNRALLVSSDTFATHYRLPRHRSKKLRPAIAAR